MARNGTVQVLFRLTKDHADRLDRAAKYCGQTKQDFLRTTILHEVSEVEERKRQKQVYTTARSSARIGIGRDPDEVDQATPEEPMGLGIAEPLRASSRTADQPERPSEAAGRAQERAQQVVVQVGSNAASGGETLDKLVTFILTGADIERTSRKRTALNILHASAGSDEERKTLTARLDEALAAKQRMPPIFSGEGGGTVGKVARVAFDKLASLLK